MRSPCSSSSSDSFKWFLCSSARWSRVGYTQSCHIMFFLCAANVSMGQWLSFLRIEMCNDDALDANNEKIANDKPSPEHTNWSAKTKILSSSCSGNRESRNQEWLHTHTHARSDTFQIDSQAHELERKQQMAAQPRATKTKFIKRVRAECTEFMLKIDFSQVHGDGQGDERGKKEQKIVSHSTRTKTCELRF